MSVYRDMAIDAGARGAELDQMAADLEAQHQADTYASAQADHDAQQEAAYWNDLRNRIHGQPHR